MNRSASAVVYAGVVGETLLIITREDPSDEAQLGRWRKGAFPALPPGCYKVKRYLISESPQYLGEVYVSGSRDE